MDGEVIDPLLRLFYESVAINFPCQFLGPAADFLQRLINRHGTDGHWTVANDPFSRGVNIFSRAEIHYRVGAPLGRPTHFLDFFVDCRCHGAVADVCIDLYQEIAANDHRLGFRVIYVRRNNGAAARDLGSHKFWSDWIADCRLPIANWFRTRMPKTKIVAAVAGGVHAGFARAVRSAGVNGSGCSLATEILANRDEFHLGRDDSLTRVPELRDRMSR